MGPAGDFYTELGVTRQCSRAEVKKAYHELAKQYHPDVAAHGANKEGAEAKFKRITAAYEVLSDWSKRREYDRSLESPFAGHRPSGGASSAYAYRTTNTYGWAQNDPKWSRGPQFGDPKTMWQHGRTALIFAVPTVIGLAFIGGLWDTLWESANRGKRLKKVQLDQENARGQAGAQGRSL